LPSKGEAAGHNKKGGDREVSLAGGKEKKNSALNKRICHYLRGTENPQPGGTLTYKAAPTRSLEKTAEGKISKRKNVLPRDYCSKKSCPGANGEKKKKKKRTGPKEERRGEMKKYFVTGGGIKKKINLCSKRRRLGDRFLFALGGSVWGGALMGGVGLL